MKRDTERESEKLTTRRCWCWFFSFFMGKNTPERQDFIIGNLRVEKDLVEV